MEESETEYKKKRSVAALSHIQHHINLINHKQSKWEYREYDHTHHKFWGGFASYMDKNARNKTMFKFP